MVETNVITLALSNGFQAQDTGGNCSALVRHFKGMDVVITTGCTIPETVTDTIEVGVYEIGESGEWMFPPVFFEDKGNLQEFFKGKNKKGMKLRLKFHSADTGFCRVYYKSEINGLYCTQEEEEDAFIWYVCSKDGEPECRIKEGVSVEIVKSF
jgi:hypothetical protein